MSVTSSFTPAMFENRRETPSIRTLVIAAPPSEEQQHATQARTEGVAEALVEGLDGEKHPCSRQPVRTRWSVPGNQCSLDPFLRGGEGLRGARKSPTRRRLRGGSRCGPGASRPDAGHLRPAA